MPQDGNNAPAEVDKKTETVAPAEGQQPPVADPAPAVVEAPAPAPVDPKPEATIGEVLPESNPAPAPKEPEAPRMVPEAVLIKLKKDFKDLKDSIDSGDVTTKSEVNKSLKDLGEKYDVNPDFLQELASNIRSETESEFNKRLEQELEPYKKTTEAARATEVDKVFTEHFDKTLEAMPEYKGVANKEIIKALALDPKNANKTFAKILEEAYGHLIEGRTTLDDAKPGNGKGVTEIDYARAAKDSEYFAQIMADPVAKKKYNENLQSRLRL